MIDLNNRYTYKDSIECHIVYYLKTNYDELLNSVFFLRHHILLVQCCISSTIQTD